MARPVRRGVLAQVPLHEGWIGQSLRALEAATDARIAFLTRFGWGVLPTGSTMLQDGDLLHVMVTDDTRTPSSRSRHRAADRGA